MELENDSSFVPLIAFLLDLLVLVLGIRIANYAKQLGGQIGHKSLFIITAGFVIIALAYIGETLTHLLFEEMFHLHGDMIEVLHRVLVVIGLGLIVYGYGKLIKFAKL